MVNYMNLTNALYQYPVKFYHIKTVFYWAYVLTRKEIITRQHPISWTKKWCVVCAMYEIAVHVTYCTTAHLFHVVCNIEANAVELHSVSELWLHNLSVRSLLLYIRDVRRITTRLLTTVRYYLILDIIRF